MSSITKEISGVLVEQIKALSILENKVYACHDYLSPTYQAELRQRKQNQHRGNDATSFTVHSENSSVSLSNSRGINEAWREKICEWIFQVIDVYNYDRNIVFILLNHLDRYLSKHIVDKETFQLAGITSLFLAVKL